MFYREKKIDCGSYREADIIPRTDSAEKAVKGRRGKSKKVSEPKQKDLNEKNSKRYLVQLGNGNFGAGDLHVTFTYSEKYLPRTEAEAERRIGNYLSRIAYRRKKLGLPPLKYILVKREKFGHWEMDSVMGCKGSKQALLVLTERRTRMGIIVLVEDHTAESVVKAINRLERKFGKLFYTLFKSITVDNGCEFQDFEGIEVAHRRKGKRTIVFFCHPYSAYERGSNENMNRLIRRFFPKGTNFDEVTKEQVAEAERWINNYPRKLLGWKSAADLFDEELQAA